MAGIEDTAELLEKQLASEISKMTLEEALTLARAFSHYLNLMGIAETHHRYVQVSDNFWNWACWHCIMYSFHAGYVRHGIWRIYQNLVMKSLISCCRVEHRLTNFMTLFASRFVCTGIFLSSFLWQLGWSLKLTIKKAEEVFKSQFVFLEILTSLGDASTRSA